MENEWTREVDRLREEKRDLVEACKALVEWAGYSEGTDDDSEEVLQFACFRNAVAAIAKAERKTP